MTNNIEGRLSLRDGYRLARTVGDHLKDRSNYTAKEFVKVAEKAARENPDDWVTLYALGTKYPDVGNYYDSIQILGHCVELRPKDIRSVYALATSYNLLTRAGYTKEQVEKANKAMGLAGYDKVDPDLAKREIKRARLTLETAASQAIRWFERALELNPDNQSRMQIQQDLETLYKRFPKLRH